MWFSQLSIENFRNIKNATIAIGEHANILYGPNGSGKTSVLEAIYYLSHAKSFRTRVLSEIINWEEKAFRVKAKLVRGTARSSSVPVGIERSGRQIQIRYDGKNIYSAAELATKFYVVFLSPDSHEIVKGGPKQRRKIIDWAWFHVEPSYIGIWRTYYHLLKQRNAGLKRRVPKREIMVWNEAFVEQAEQLTKARQRYANALNSYLADTALNFLDRPIAVSYLSGWNDNLSFAEQLYKSFSIDVESGYTTTGPHRADLAFTIDERPASTVLSRGQMKLLIYTLRLAEVLLIKDRTGQLPIVMIDDIGAELDGTNQQRLLEFLHLAKVQVVATTTSLATLHKSYIQDSVLFHVKHGRLSPSENH